MTNEAAAAYRRGLSEQATQYAGQITLAQPLKAKTLLAADGRIVIPVAMRKAMGANEGSTVVLLMHGETLEVFTAEAGIRRAQARLAPYVEGGPSLADELIEDRRREAAEEDLD